MHPMTHVADQELLLRIDAVARRLAISRSVVQRLIQRGELPTIHIGRSVRIPALALERWVAAHVDRTETSL